MFTLIQENKKAPFFHHRWTTQNNTACTHKYWICQHTKAEFGIKVTVHQQQLPDFISTSEVQNETEIVSSPVLALRTHSSVQGTETPILKYNKTGNMLGPEEEILNYKFCESNSASIKPFYHHPSNLPHFWVPCIWKQADKLGKL